MPDHSDVRWRQRFQNFKKAFAQLAKGVSVAQQRELNEREQQGLIQASEFTHELAWNTLKDFLAASGSTTNLYGSKDATRAAFAAELVADGDVWMEMTASRNATTHTYDEATANEIAGAFIGRYTPEFERFLYRFTQLESNER